MRPWGDMPPCHRPGPLYTHTWWSAGPWQWSDSLQQGLGGIRMRDFCLFPPVLLLAFMGFNPSVRLLEGTDSRDT